MYVASRPEAPAPPLICKATDLIKTIKKEQDENEQRTYGNSKPTQDQ